MVAARLRTLAAAFALCALPGTASAQVTGTVTGTVKDPQGGVIPGASVSLMDTGSNRPLLQMNVESISEVKVLTSV